MSIDKFIDATVLSRDPVKLSYRKRDQVSSIRKMIDDFEKTKREYNKGIRYTEDDLKRLSGSILFIEQQVVQMKEEYVVLQAIQDGKHIQKEILRNNIQTLVEKYGATLFFDEYNARYSYLKIPAPAIKLKHNGKQVILGPFEIIIKPNGCLSSIQIHGDIMIGYCCHPHVLEGRPCLGNLQTPVLKLLLGGQWVKLYYLLFEGFLHSHNPGSVYRGLGDWLYQYCDECGRFEDRCDCNEDEAEQPYEDTEYEEDPEEEVLDTSFTRNLIAETVTPDDIPF